METFVKKISVFFILLTSLSTFSQGTLEDYKRANALDSLYRDKLINSPSSFVWLDNGLMWYVNNGVEGKEYLWVDPGKRTQKKIFDHQTLAKLLSEQFEKEIDPHNIQITELDFSADLKDIHFIFDGKKLSFNTVEDQLTILDPKVDKRDREWGYWGRRFDETTNPPVASPDSSMTAYIRDHNLFVKEGSSGKEIQLSYDGALGFFYSSHIQWSPDGKKIMAYKVRPGADRKIYFVESSPQDQLQPKLQSRDYLKPGDELPFRSPQLFLLDGPRHIQIPTGEFNHQYSLGNFQWRQDSRAFTFEYNQRGHQAYKVIEVNAVNGRPKVLIDEKSETFIDYSSKK